MGLIIFTPLLFLISIAILVFDGFPVLFVQARLGKDKEEFNMSETISLLRHMFKEEHGTDIVLKPSPVSTTH